MHHANLCAIEVSAERREFQMPETQPTIVAELEESLGLIQIGGKDWSEVNWDLISEDILEAPVRK
jgi:hypothetical protein